MASHATRFVLGMASTAVLARLLRPEDFGLIAMVTAVVGFVALFKDLGLSTATVQRKQISHAQVSTLFWLNVVLSVVATLLTAAIAPWIAAFYGKPELTRITVVLAVAFVFGGLTVQHQALLRRKMRFGRLAVVNIAALCVSIVVGISSAALGAGYWSLVFMPIAGSIVAMVGVWLVSGWRPGFPVRGAGVRRMVAFGGNLTAFGVINYFARNLDNVLIGRVWGGQALGFYSRAYNLLTLPLRQVNEPIRAVAIPALSRLQSEPERFRRYYLRGVSLIMFLTAPVSVLCLVLAEEIILGVLGPQWLGAVNIFRLLAISALIQPVYNTAGFLYVPTGRTDELLKYGSIGVALIVLSFFVGLPYGPESVALCYSCAMVIWFWPCMHFATRKTLVTVGDIVRTALDSLGGAAAGGAAVLAMKYGLGEAMGLWVRLGLGIVIMTAVYLVTVFFLFGRRRFYGSVFGMLRGSGEKTSDETDGPTNR